MTSVKLDNFDRALHTAERWLSQIADQLNIDDNRAAYRLTRTWLHLMRDRLTVTSAAKFGAQLPELIRGVYYDGWEPAHAPVKYSAAEFVARFAVETNTPVDDVPRITASITAALSQRMPGPIAELLAQLPRGLRAVVEHGTAVGAAGPHPDGGEVTDLRAQVETLTEAVRTLVIGLEGSPLDDELDSEARRARAARRATEMLMTIR